MSIIQPQYPASRRFHPTWRDVNQQQLVDDSFDEALERRIADLEHALVDRKARRRLRREIRRADRDWRQAEATWEARRLEIAFYRWSNQPSTHLAFRDSAAAGDR